MFNMNTIGKRVCIIKDNPKYTQKAKYPDEEIIISDAKEWAAAAMRNKREVRICDGGDMLVFHSVNGAVVYGEGFWEAVTK